MTVHHLSCHCGAVSADVECALENLMTCNCSMCGRTGAIMVFVPGDRLTNRKGEEHLTDYQFAKKTVHHAFCAICGARPYAWGTGHDGQPWAMINVRCVEGVDVHTLEIARRADGRAL